MGNSDTKTIGIGEFDVIREKGERIKTYALGSCVAVVIFCPRTDTVGMVHIALPSSSIDPVKGEKLPGYFANTAIPTLIKKMRMAGCVSPLREFTAKITGGATMVHFSGSRFNIGERNTKEIIEICNKVRIKIIASETGGTINRTVTAASGSKSILINNPSIGSWEL